MQDRRRLKSWITLVSLMFVLVTQGIVGISGAYLLLTASAFVQYDRGESMRLLFEERLVDVAAANRVLAKRGSGLRITGQVDVLGAPMDDYSGLYRELHSSEFGSIWVEKASVWIVAVPVALSVLGLVLCVVLIGMKMWRAELSGDRGEGQKAGGL